MPAIVQTTGQPCTADSPTVVFTLGAAPAAGNLLVAFCSWNSGTGQTIETPAGWVQVATSTDGANNAITGFWHVVQSGDGTGYTFSFTGASHDYTSGALYELSSTDHGSPVNQYALAGYPSGLADLLTGTATPTSLDTLPLAGWTTNGGDTVSGIAPAGWSADQVENSAYHSTYTGHGPATSDTSTGIAATLSLAGSDTGASLLLLIGTDPPPVPYIVQTSGVPAQSQGTISFALSAAPRTGDMLVAFCSFSQAGATRTVSPPGGAWASAGTITSGSDSLATYYYITQSGDGTSWPFPVATSVGNDFCSGVMYEVTGQAATGQVNGQGSQGYPVSSGTFTTAAVAPSVSGCLPLAALTTDGPHTVTSLSAGWDGDQAEATGYHATYTAHQRLLSSGTASLSNTWVLSGSDVGASEILLIAPGARAAAAARAASPVAALVAMKVI